MLPIENVLQLLGLLITYFLLVVQMTSYSLDSSADAHNVTTAAVFTTVGTK